MRTRVLLFLILCLTLMGVLPAAAQTSYAFIRVAHTAGDAPAVDVYLNGQLTTIQGLTLGDVTPWIAVPAGAYTAAITVAGAPVENAVASVEGLELSAGTWATISAVGTLANDSLALQPAVEDYATAIADNTSRVTVFHALEGMSGIDLVRNGASMIDTIAYPSADLGNDGAASVELLAETTTLQITAAGRTDAVITTIPDVTLLEKGFVSIFVYGTLQAPLYSIQVVTPAEVTLVSTGNVLTTETLIIDPAVAMVEAAVEVGAVAFVRVGHFGADAPNVDIYLDGELSSVVNLAYGSVTDWFAVPAGAHVIAATVTGAPVANAVMSLEVELASDSWTTISAVGTLEADTLTLSPATEDYKTAIATGVTRVSLFHAITDMSGVDLVRNGVSLIDTVTFPQPDLGNDGMASVEVAAGTVTFAISAADRADAVIVGLEPLELAANSYVAIFVYGTLDAPLYTVKVITQSEVTLLRRTS